MTNAYIEITGEILKEFNVAPDTGLTRAEVIHRRGQFGPNHLTQAARRPEYRSTALSISTIPKRATLATMTRAQIPKPTPSYQTAPYQTALASMGHK